MIQAMMKNPMREEILALIARNARPISKGELRKINRKHQKVLNRTKVRAASKREIMLSGLHDVTIEAIAEQLRMLGLDSRAFEVYVTIGGREVLMMRGLLNTDGPTAKNRG